MVMLDGDIHAAHLPSKPEGHSWKPFVIMVHMTIVPCWLRKTTSNLGCKPAVNRNALRSLEIYSSNCLSIHGASRGSERFENSLQGELEL